MNIPKKVKDRIILGMKKFQAVLTGAKSRDVNESDTSAIVQDMLHEIFGYEKYSEITTEYAIRSTYCDLAIKIDSSVKLLIELKAIGLSLKDHFIKQAVDYAVNQGTDWVVLSNGELWQVYKVTFGKPVNFEMVQEINFLNINPRNNDDLQSIFLLCKESWSKSALEGYYERIQLINKYTIGAILLSDEAVSLIRRNLKRISSDIKVENDLILHTIQNEVLKREILEGEKAEKAKRQIARSTKKDKKEKDAAKAA